MDFLYMPIGTTRLLAGDWYTREVWTHNAPQSPDTRYYDHFIICHASKTYRHGPPISPCRAQVKALIFNAVAVCHTQKGD